MRNMCFLLRGSSPLSDHFIGNWLVSIRGSSNINKMIKKKITMNVFLQLSFYSVNTNLIIVSFSTFSRTLFVCMPMRGGCVCVCFNIPSRISERKKSAWVVLCWLSIYMSIYSFLSKLFWKRIIFIFTVKMFHINAHWLHYQSKLQVFAKNLVEMGSLCVKLCERYCEYINKFKRLMLSGLFLSFNYR